MEDKITIEEVQDDISKYKSIVSLQNLDGGKLLVDSLEKSVSGGVENILAAYKTVQHTELIALISKLDANLSLLKVLTRADANLALAQEEYRRILAE